MFGKATDTMLAIDLAPEAVRVLEVAVRQGAPSIITMASEALGKGSVESLPERHIAALESVISTQRIRSRQCVATMPTNLVTTRSVLIDPGKPLSLEEQIRATLQAIQTHDPRSLLFDFWKVSEKAPQNRPYEVLVVAAQRSILQQYLDGFKKLRLNCTHMDVAPCALASLIEKLMPEQESMVGVVVLGEGLGYFAVVEKQRVLFWRPFELPEKRQQAGLERVGDEISKCVSHMVGALQFDGMTDILVFGENAQDSGFANYLTTRFNLQVRSPSPFESLPTNGMPEQLRSAIEPSAATHYAAAMGLALQPTGGSNG
jgi:Tfp pilus assembly PilM family ATPase